MIAAIISVIVLIVLSLTAHLPVVRHYVRDYAQDYLSKHENVDVEIGSLNYNLFTLSSSLHDVSIGRTANGNLPPFVTAQEIDLKLSLSDLLVGRLTIEQGTIRQMALRIVVDKQGNSNLPSGSTRADGAASTSSSLSIPFFIEDLRANGPVLEIDDQRRQLAFRVPQWRLMIQGNRASQEETIAFASEQAGLVVWRGRQLPVNQTELKLVFQKDTLLFHNATIRVGSTVITTKGQVENLSHPNLNLAVNVSVDLRDLATATNLGQPLDGQVNYQATIRQEIADLKIAGTLQGSSLTLGPWRKVSLKAQPTWDRRTDHLIVEGISVTSSTGAFSGQANLALAGGSSTSGLRGRFRDIPLEVVSGTLHSPLEIGSRATGEINLRWAALNFREPTGTANAVLQTTSREPSRNVLPVSGSVALLARGTQVAITVNSFHAAGTDLSGHVRLSSWSGMTGEIHGQVAQLSETTSNLDQLLGLPKGRLSRGSIPNGSMHFNARLGGSLQQPRISLLADSGDLSIRDVRDMTLHFAGEYQDRRLTISRAALAWQGQNVTASGEVSFLSKSPDLNLAVAADRVSIGQLLAVIGRTTPVDGRFNLSAALSGNLAEPSAQISATADNLEAYGESLGHLALESSLANQQINVSHFTLQKPSPEGPEGIFQGTGSYDFRGGQYSISGQGENLSIQHLTLPNGLPVQGTVALTVDGSGTVQNPSLKVQTNIGKLELAHRQYGNVSLSGQLAGAEAILALQAPQLNLQADSRIRVAAPYPVTVNVLTNNTDLSLLTNPVLGAGLFQGSLSSEIKGTVEILDWKKSNVVAQVSGIQLNFKGEEFRNEGPLQIGLSDGILKFTSADLTGANSELRLSGTLPLEPTSAQGALKIRANLDSGQVMKLATASAGLQASGKVEVEGTVGGSLWQLDPTLTVAVRDGQLASQGSALSLKHLDLSAHSAEGVLVVESATAEVASGIVSVQGKLPLEMMRSAGLPLRTYPPGELAQAQVRVAGLNLADIPQLPEHVGGQASLMLKVGATRLALESLAAHAQFDQLRLDLLNATVQQSEPTRLSLDRGILTVDAFRLNGPGTNLAIQGKTKLTEPTTLDIDMAGYTDLGLLALSDKQVQASGRTQINLAVRGNLREPQLRGSAALSGGRIVLPSPPLQADQLQAQVQLSRGRVTIQNLAGALNGGEFRGSGTFGLSGTTIREASGNFSIQNMFLNFPEGLQTSSEADIRLTTTDDQIFIGGEARILEGSFRRNVDLQTELVHFLQSGQNAIPEGAKRSAFLSQIRFNLPVRTMNPIVVDNNLAQLSATANLRLVGTYYKPSVTGLVTMEEGGQLHLQENDYVIDTGTIEFLNANRIEPSLTLVAETEASGYSIQLHISGTPEKISTSMTSDPQLPEPDIVSVLLTGRTLQDARSGGINVAKEQGLSFLTSAAGERVSQAAQQTIGLSRVRVEPNLIASESDPAVRLTLGQNITRQLQLIYSMNLANSGDQIYKAEYSLGRRFEADAVKQSDNTYRFGFQQELRLGGSQFLQMQQRLPQRKVGKIVVTGHPIFESSVVLDKIGLVPGDKFDYMKVRKGIDRITEFYRKKQYLEASIHLKQEKAGLITNLTLDIEAGPQVEFSYEGIKVPSSIQNEVALDWQRDVFEEQRVQDAETSLRRWLVEQHYLQAMVAHKISYASETLKRVQFQIQPGIRYEKQTIVFEGSSAVPASELKDYIANQKLPTAIYLQPAKVAESLAAYYKNRGYLEAQVQPPSYSRQPVARTERTTIRVQEGPLYSFGKPDFEGNRAFSDAKLRANILIQGGLAYDPDLPNTSVSQLEGLYWTAGYNNVSIDFSTHRDPSRRELQVLFHIKENKQEIVESVAVRGNQAVGEKFIRRRVPFEKGNVYNASLAGEARSSLYNTGAFSFVDFQSEAAGPSRDSQQPTSVIVDVHEVRPFLFHYGGFYDTDRGPGATFDFENRNSLGNARTVQFQARYDSQIHEVRSYFGEPVKFGSSSTLSASGFRRREITVRTGLSDSITDRTGFSVQQQVELHPAWLVNYGYRFERTHTFDQAANPNCPLPPSNPLCRFDQTLNVAPLTGSISRDTRDDPLSATRGMFFSNSVEYAIATLGSDLRYLRYFGQFDKYVPLSAPVSIPLSRGPKLSRFVYAGGVRVGLGTGFAGQSLTQTERFFAGGGTTIRGLKQDAVGPKDALGNPLGGQALLIINNELRFPLISLFGGGAFLDLGNVYPRVSDFDPLHVRKTAGIGLRVHTPYVLLRLDYGRKLDRKPGESAGEIFFSIGQAF